MDDTENTAGDASRETEKAWSGKSPPSADELALRRAVGESDVSASEAAEAALRVRSAAGRAGADLVAEGAQQDAVAARLRADSAATRVRLAADGAATIAQQEEPDPTSPDALRRAAAIAATVQATAEALADHTASLAQAVASSVAATAEQVAVARSALDRSIEVQVAAAAAAAELQALVLAAAGDGPDAGADA